MESLSEIIKEGSKGMTIIIAAVHGLIGACARYAVIFLMGVEKGEEKHFRAIEFFLYCVIGTAFSVGISLLFANYDWAGAVGFICGITAKEIITIIIKKAPSLADSALNKIDTKIKK